MIESVTRNQSKSSYQYVRYLLLNWKKKVGDLSKQKLMDEGWLIVFAGFLLGRAIILDSVAPFAVAFFASIWMLRRNISFKVALAVLVGSLTIHVEHAIYLFSSLFLFCILAALFKKASNQQKIIPLFVFISCLIPRISGHVLIGQVETYQWVLTIVEAGLSVVLVLIFMQSVPILSPKRVKKDLKNEEIVCVMILIASVLTGTIGWIIMDASVEQVFSRYFVLVLAYIGGAAIGSTVGVVTGLVLSLADVASLYQMSLLAFAGLLGGLLKDGKKVGVGLGLFIATLLIGIYGEGQGNQFAPTLIETGFAIILFFGTPEKLIRKMARYIPGTNEYTEEQEQYLQKVRDVTAHRVEQFSDMFQALSKSFLRIDGVHEPHKDSKETDFFLSHVTEKTCQSCFKKESCWVNNFDQTYDYMTEIMSEMEDGTLDQRRRLKRDFDKHCVKSKKVYDTMKSELSFYQANQRLKKQVQESRKFVAEQLKGVSDVMDNFAKEIMKERQIHEQQESEIVYAINELGFEIEKLDIYSLEPGRVDIEMNLSFYDYRGEASKIIAPVLSEILQETVIVDHEEVSPFTNGYGFFSFKSAQQYNVQTGVSHAAKGGGFISGDSYLTLELGSGRYALAISDGMGNGERAYLESMETLRLLQQILQSGINEKVAIKSINSILSLRTTDEIFSTLDLAVIDLHHAGVKFLKIGSTPSFIKRSSDIMKVEASNLPIGIIKEFDVDVVNEQLKPGDILIMMSDGIFEGPKHVENVDLWLKRKIKEMETENPQEIADLILEEVVRTKSGTIDDDMTVLVAKIEDNIPEWASFPLHKAQ
ncbi:stage II sporulation protein E [Salinibacillus xinjiangensis]|uniref:Stage II sporulation protein E n=1 Tax=Salinibacillus xinjiangensis TaxID=1229268 RepID=A0A6G1XBM1_9BACI|nr:stage II sporulation protein E [Salinibacillus xinjiangensis]MRG88188.1 stage II sporulation protein E [Salinibacillus xinjiangensis]